MRAVKANVPAAGGTAAQERGSGASKTAGRGIPGAIAAAAASLFREHGFAATSMQQIADAAGMTRPTLYYYFRNKEEILASLVEEITMQSLRQAFQRGAEKQDAPAPRLRASVRAYALWILQHLEQFSVLSRNENELPQADRLAQRQGRRDLLTALRSLIEEGMERGEFRVVDPTVAAFSIFGMCNWTLEWFRSDGRLSEEQTADAVADLALAMLRRPLADGRAEPADASAWLEVLRDDIAHLERAVTDRDNGRP